MKLTDFYNQVAGLVDTDTTKINVAETKRVLAIAFSLLEQMDATEMADTIAKGLAQAKKKRTK
ncbi:MAG: hypothetical protein KDA84_18980 [Planctomycetaceae bacterium]|nr:hypothetical protein [Planctomycetaceae bacterium]